MTSGNIVLLILGPLAALLTWSATLASGMNDAAAITAGITVLCAIWWIFEPVPIPVTSLLPLALFQLFDVLTPDQIGASYGSSLILLLLGGFILSSAMERSGAHRRVALGMVNLFGGSSPRRLVFGFMTAAAVLSMWISNAATTLMLLPVAIAVLQRNHDPELEAPLLLGIAYAASVGGLGTPIGTPPNLVFREVFAVNTGVEIGFLTWMGWALPVVVLMVPVMGFWLTRSLKQVQSFDMPAVGHWQPAEKRVMVIFAITAIAWMTRAQPLGGWSELFGVPGTNDATVALIAAAAMFMVPDGNGQRLLDWDTAERIPWGMLILFGGGIAIAKAFTTSGLSTAMGEALSALASLPLLLMIVSICLIITFMTEMTSNTATTTLMMPILAAAALAAGIKPELLMVPAAMSASCAFMLPVATAPNTIVFSTGRFSIKAMARAGLVMNLLGVLVISAVCYTILG